MKLSEKLKELRCINNMTATYVSYQLGIAKSTLSNYEKGIRTPKVKTLSKFAEFYNTTLDSLVNESKYPESNVEFISKFIKNNPIPILGNILNSDPFKSNIIGYTDLDREYAGKGEYFALYVKGDRMNNARICEGDIVIVRKQSFAENGEIAVVGIDGEDASISKVFYTDNTITLMPCSTNAEHKLKIIDLKNENVNVFGKVVEVKIKL